MYLHDNNISDMLYAHLRYHNDAMIKTQEDFFNKICLPLTLLQGFEKVIQGFRMRGSWRLNRNCNILTPNLWPAMLCLSRSPDAQSEALGSTLLGAGFLYCILSVTSVVPKLNGGFRGPPRPGVAFPTTSCPSPTGTLLQLAVELNCLSYIIVQRPLDL